MKNTYIFDFDGTITKLEGLDELFKISLKHDPNREEIQGKIEDITREGMEGTIGFDESLKRRISLLKANKEHIYELITLLKANISASILKNKEFFKNNRDDIFILSGGFKEFMLPITEELGIKDENVYGNTFIFKEEQIIWFDENNPLSKKDGKITQLKQLNLKGNVIIIGDGYTDYRIKEEGLANTFIAFTENFKRQSVMEKADRIINDFNDFCITIKIPKISN